MRKQIRAAAAALALGTLAAACDGGSPAGGGTRDPVMLRLSPHEATVPAGGTQPFGVTGRDGAGNPVTVHPTFTTTGGSVDAEGVYSAPAAAGTYLVIAEQDGLADTARVVVTGTAVPQSVTITPPAATVQVGGTAQFAAQARYADGSTAAVTPAWTATGGTISAAGLYTAGAAAGTYAVVATFGGRADTAAVTVTTGPAPTLASVTVTPAATSVAAGGTAQFGATGTFSNGSSAPVPVTWTATGGTISATGLYTAGQAAGVFRVTATAAGGLAATADVTVTAPPPPGSGYRAVVSEDWHGYADRTALRQKQYFWWFDSANRDVYSFVDLVQDPAFGQVARITFPQNSGSPGSSPRLTQPLPAPVGDLWYRWRMKFQPGWTTVGPDPAGSANSYKIAFFTWETGFGSRGELELSNSTQYITGVGVQDAGGSYLRYTETLLPNSAPDFGSVGSEWSDGEWWEYVIHYKKTGPSSAVYQYWRRRLTSGGSVSPAAWSYHGMSMSGSTTPRVASIDLGCNKNKNNPSTMYIYWGKWEVVDGAQYPNPFSMPNAQ
ncbi:MAG TPA: hypothetical protein VFJ16_28290 [Longimicrobium sp.]|nr:hypothetical protein [Longimicrobium sp.]